MAFSTLKLTQTFSTTLSLLLLLFTTLNSPATTTTTAQECPYPCYPPPTGPGNTPQPPTTMTPPSQPVINYPPPAVFNSPPSPIGVLPYNPPAPYYGYGGDGMPPPPDPIVPWFPYYYRKPPRNPDYNSASSTMTAAVLRGGSRSTAVIFLTTAVVLVLLVGKLNCDDIKRVASHLCEPGSSHQVDAGYCLNCGAYCDLEASVAVVNEAGIYFRRLEDALDSGEVHRRILLDALRSLDLLKSKLHPFNKKVAKVEDKLAQAFCLVRELEPASEHCKSSIKILEKLHGLNHIVIGNELVKLISIQLCLGDPAVVESITALDVIFSRYYGSHASVMFPQLEALKREVSRHIA